MEFKRLNSMTGKDPVLNRRIASIFLSDFEGFLTTFSNLPEIKEFDTLKFLIHKNSPSFMIFELESLLSRYNLFLDKKMKGERIELNDPGFQDLLEDTKLKIEQVRDFISSID
ncbi:MAG: hypothetical protein KAZ11_01380 [Chitinophagaceae bacterium]|nr:hypothetical protein [Chitinophagaceae bacterium]